MRKRFTLVLLLAALTMFCAGCDFGAMEDFFAGGDDEAQAATTPPADDEEDVPPPHVPSPGTVTVVCMGKAFNVYFDEDSANNVKLTGYDTKLVTQTASALSAGDHQLHWGNKEDSETPKTWTYDFQVDGDMTLMVIMDHRDEPYVIELPTARTIEPDA
jgi:hypothetical protein